MINLRVTPFSNGLLFTTCSNATTDILLTTVLLMKVVVADVMCTDLLASSESQANILITCFAIF